MNHLNVRSAGRILAGYFLGLIIAMVSPMCLLTELLSLMPVVLIPSTALILIRHWSGTAPAVFAALMQVAFAARYAGQGYLWFFFFLSVFPVIILWRGEKKPFLQQMHRSIFAFGAGCVLALVALYLAYGGNMIERAFLLLGQIVRRLPDEALERIAVFYGSVSGIQPTSEGFIQAFDGMIAQMIPMYQLNLPGLVFSGSLITAVVCVALNARLQNRQKARLYLPLRHWAMPASATFGLLMITLISFVMSKTAMRGGEVVFNTVLSITATAFCIQTVSSVSRKLHMSKMKAGAKHTLIILIALLCMLGAYSYGAIYGCASAIFGSKGALRQYAQDIANRSDHDSSNDV